MHLKPRLTAALPFLVSVVAACGDDTDPSDGHGVHTDDVGVQDAMTGRDGFLAGDTMVPPGCAGGDGPDFTVGHRGAIDFVINGERDPALTVVRGCSYTFNMTANGHPFLIKTVQVSDVENTYDTGVDGNGTAVGTITWTVPNDAPSRLFYICLNHLTMTNTITVIDPSI